MRMIRSHAFALAAAVLAAVPAAAQQAVLRGQVVDQATGQPVATAAVYLGSDRVSAITDAQGRFELRHVRTGPQAMWADAPGYTMEILEVQVPEGQSTVTLRMQGDPVRLATLNVSTSRLERRTLAFAGSSRVFREGDLAGMSYNNLLEMVELRGGVRPVPCPHSQNFPGQMSCVFTRGTSSPAQVYIDETKWLGGLNSLEDFFLPEIARVEVYAQGREVRIYTRQFMEWASRRAYVPAPIGLGI